MSKNSKKSSCYFLSSMLKWKCNVTDKEKLFNKFKKSEINKGCSKNEKNTIRNK